MIYLVNSKSAFCFTASAGLTILAFIGINKGGPHVELERDPVQGSGTRCKHPFTGQDGAYTADPMCGRQRALLQDEDRMRREAVLLEE
jgi:hypothetical protein